MLVALEKTGLDIVLLLNITHLYCTPRSKSSVIGNGSTSLFNKVVDLEVPGGLPGFIGDGVIVWEFGCNLKVPDLFTFCTEEK